MMNLKVVFIVSLLSILAQAKFEVCNLHAFRDNWVETVNINKFRFYKAINAPPKVLYKIKDKNPSNWMNVREFTEAFRMRYSVLSVEQEDILFSLIKKGPVQIKLINGLKVHGFLSCEGNILKADYKISSHEKITVYRHVEHKTMFVRYEHKKNYDKTIYEAVYRKI